MGRALAGVAAAAMTATPSIASASSRQTVDIPVLMAPVAYSAVNYPANSPPYYCPPDNRRMDMGAAPPGFIRVGFEHHYDDGTWPAPCEWVQTNLQRLRMSFDISQIKARMPRAFVYSAKLSYDRRHIAGSNDCPELLVTVIGEDQDGSYGMGQIRPQTEERFDNPLPSASCIGERCTVDIKGQVNEWLQGGARDLGMVIRGSNEGIGTRDNLACTSDYGNLKLLVDYSFEEAALATPILKSLPPVAPATPVVPILKVFPTPSGGGGGGGGSTSPITLTVTFVKKQGGNAIYDLGWTKTAGGMLDVVRSGTVIDKVKDSGSARDKAPLGTQKYKICLSGTATCSNEVTVTN